MAKARAEIEITASEGKLAAGLARARSRFQAFSGSIARGMGSAMSSAWSGVKMPKLKGSGFGAGQQALGTFGGNMMTRAADSFMDAANGVRDFERDLVRLGIAGNLSGEKLAALRTAIRQVSTETGVSSSEILKGTQTYVDLTGDIDGATNAQRSFARIAQASGASVADVATASAALREAMKLDSGDIEAAFSGLIVQGKAGAVSVKDFAGELAELAPQFAMFKGAQGVDGIREMGAAFQIVRKGAGSASMAATQLASLIRGLSDSETIKKLGKLGINVLTPDGKLREFSEILGEIAKNPAFDKATVLGDVFGRAEAQNALRTLRNNVTEMENLKNAGKDAGAVQKDLNNFLASDAGRLDAAFNKMKESIVTAFTPERIQAFVSLIEKVGGAIGKVVSGVEKLVKFLEDSNKDEDDRAKDMVDSAKGFNVRGKRNAADELTKRADAKAPIDEAVSRHFGGANGAFMRAINPFFPTEDTMRKDFGMGSGAERAAASKLYAQANAEAGDPWAQGYGAGSFSAGAPMPVSNQTPDQQMNQVLDILGKRVEEAMRAGWSNAKIEIPTARIAAGAEAGSANGALGGKNR